MRFKRSSYARLRTGEMGRTVADVYNDEGMLIDRITGTTRSDCLESLSIQYPHVKILEHDGTKVRWRKPKYMMAPTEGTEPNILDRTVDEILKEIMGERTLGKIKPFIEGEAIGKLPDRFYE